MKIGDYVWTSRIDHATYRARSRVRAEVVDVYEGHTYKPRFSVKFGDGRVETRWADDCEVYNAVDSLADLVRCRRCVDYGQDRCADHAGVLYLDAVTASTTGWVTYSDLVTASNVDPITALGDIVREPERRPLTDSERLKRSRRRQASKQSRRRNRSR